MSTDFWSEERRRDPSSNSGAWMTLNHIVVKRWECSGRVTHLCKPIQPYTHTYTDHNLEPRLGPQQVTQQPFLSRNTDCSDRRIIRQRNIILANKYDKVTKVTVAGPALYFRVHDPMQRNMDWITAIDNYLVGGMDYGPNSVLTNFY